MNGINIMHGIIIKNGIVLNSESEGFEIKNVCILDGKTVTYEYLSEHTEDCTIIDAKGNYVLPGLIDIHTHGARLFDFAHSKVDDILNMTEHYVTNGVTTIFPTVASDSRENMLKAIENICAAAEKCEKVNIEGIHMEGPFLSLSKKGAHRKEYLRMPDKSELDEWIKASNNKKLYLTIAPELPGALKLISYAVSRGITVTIGHTETDENTFKEAMSRGASCVTHLYNAQSPLHHREAGAVGTALTEDIYTELICDGHHVCPEIVKLTYKMKGAEKLILITDSMSAAGVKETDRPFSISGNDVFVSEGMARLSDGTLAGSLLNLREAVKNFRSFSGCPLSSGILAASRNPAKLMKIYSETGSIDIGKRADIIIADRDMNIKTTICAGIAVYTP